jgi:thioredoxin 1
MSSILPATTATFDEMVLQREKPVLVDFWADWCGPCRMLSPMLEDIAVRHSETLAVVKVDIDQNADVAETYGVMSVPTLMVFSGGQPVKTILGAKPKSTLLREIAAFL